MPLTRTHDYTATLAWARQVARDPGTIYLDTETTGLGSTAEIVDVAVVDAAGRVLLDELVRPRYSIPRDATAIHGITDAMVAGARAWSAVAPSLGRLLDAASNVVIYNVDFDTRIMSQCNAHDRLPRFRANWQCAMQQYAVFAGRRSSRGGYRWHKLGNAAAAFGYHESNAHRALADTRLCRAVVLGMAGADAG